MVVKGEIKLRRSHFTMRKEDYERAIREGKYWTEMKEKRYKESLSPAVIPDAYKTKTKNQNDRSDDHGAMLPDPHHSSHRTTDGQQKPATPERHRLQAATDTDARRKIENRKKDRTGAGLGAARGVSAGAGAVRGREKRDVLQGQDASSPSGWTTIHELRELAYTDHRPRALSQSASRKPQAVPLLPRLLLQAIPRLSRAEDGGNALRERPRYDVDDWRVEGGRAIAPVAARPSPPPAHPLAPLSVTHLSTWGPASPFHPPPHTVSLPVSPPKPKRVCPLGSWGCVQPRLPACATERGRRPRSAQLAGSVAVASRMGARAPVHVNTLRRTWSAQRHTTVRTRGTERGSAHRYQSRRGRLDGGESGGRMRGRASRRRESIDENPLGKKKECKGVKEDAWTHR
ncbi:hypothetical protein B0H13DRAFT_2276533 [Mycena leptocephala]|nr:hypothetical protein B0H13DRAFT_2276533 [Mycena leptocephala]